MGGAGDDTLTARSLSGSHTLLGGTGVDTLTATGLVVNLDGGEGDDTLNATGLLDQSGNISYVSGGTANLSGGAGTDTLVVHFYSTASLEGGDGNDNLTVGRTRSATLSGGDGTDNLSVYLDGASSAVTDGDLYAAKTYVLDGGADNDDLTVSGSFDIYDYSYNGSTDIGYGRTTVTINGGSGDDSLSVMDNWAGNSNTGQLYGIASASLDGGEGNDTLMAGGVLHLSMTGGAGVDSFILTAQQYRTLLEGTRNFTNSDFSTTAVTAEPTLITDFTVGVGGDVLDYSDLLRNGALTYDGANPFGNGFLTLEQDGADTLLKFDADGTAGTVASSIVIARLQNVTASSLLASNFNPNYPLDGSPAVSLFIPGDDLDNILTGGSGDDTIYGYGGNDTLDGQAGSDTIYGGEGDDLIVGYFGNDTLYGENGNDTITDDQGFNVLDGGAGHPLSQNSCRLKF